MYAVVANGIQTICYNQRQLDNILTIYPYPKFAKVRDVDEGRAWLRQHTRGLNDYVFEKYGDTMCRGYASVSYKIHEDSTEYEIDTSKLGFIRIGEHKNVITDSRSDYLRVIVEGTNLNEDIIQHHVIAIRHIVKLLGEFVDLNIIVPDISIYLAIEKYTGKDYIIKSAQREFKNRLGCLAITVNNSLWEVGE